MPTVVVVVVVVGMGGAGLHEAKRCPQASGALYAAAPSIILPTSILLSHATLPAIMPGTPPPICPGKGCMHIH